MGRTHLQARPKALKGSLGIRVQQIISTIRVPDHTLPTCTPPTPNPNHNTPQPPNRTAPSPAQPHLPQTPQTAHASHSTHSQSQPECRRATIPNGTLVDVLSWILTSLASTNLFPTRTYVCCKMLLVKGLACGFYQGV